MIYTFKQRYIGDSRFYRRILQVAVPIMIESGISNLVNLLDNVMVGRIGTEQMSGVSIVNQLYFIYSLCVIGGVEGLSIFTSQFYGRGDQESVRITFRTKAWLTGLVSLLSLGILVAFGPVLIGFYLNEGSASGSLAATQAYAEQYLRVILLSLPAFALVQTYGSTLKACGETVVPMRASVTAVLTNLFLNWILIYGIHIGGKAVLPPLGVRGAAMATVISRYVEMAMLVSWAHRHTEKAPYMKGAWRSMRIPQSMLLRFTKTSAPVLINESLWSIGMSFLLQCYSMRGLDVIAAFNISSTITNLFSIIFFSMGDAVAIIVGQLLGAGKLKEARDTDRKIYGFALFFSVLTGLLLWAVSGLFPKVYETSPEIRHLAGLLMSVYALFCPMIAFCHCSYFTLRCGGKTMISFLFDSAFTWAISVPIAFTLSRFTNMPVVWIYFSVTAADLLKALLGFVLVKKGVWLNNLTEMAEKGGTMS